MANLAALRAAVFFAICEKLYGGVEINPPPVRGKRWDYPAKKTACRSNARFKRYKLLKSVTVGPGRVGPGRAAQYEKFPLVDDELARPSASLVVNKQTSKQTHRPTNQPTNHHQDSSEQLTCIEECGYTRPPLIWGGCSPRSEAANFRSGHEIAAGGSYHGRRHRGGGGDRGTGPPQTFQRLTLCIWALHGKNRLRVALVPPPPFVALWCCPWKLCHRICWKGLFHAGGWVMKWKTFNFWWNRRIISWFANLTCVFFQINLVRMVEWAATGPGAR